MKLKNFLVLFISLVLTACATPRSADNVTLARVAKDYIGVGSIDEITISNVQKFAAEEGFGRTNYRYFVDTARKKKFICDVSLAGLGAEGKPIGQDRVSCTER